MSMHLHSLYVLVRSQCIGMWHPHLQAGQTKLSWHSDNSHIYNMTLKWHGRDWGSGAQSSRVRWCWHMRTHIQPTIHPCIHACVHPFTHAYVQICTEIEFLRDFFHVIKCWSVCLVTRKLLLESQHGQREILVLEKGHQMQLVLFTYFQTSCVVCIHACYLHVFLLRNAYRTET